MCEHTQPPIQLDKQEKLSRRRAFLKCADYPKEGLHHAHPAAHAGTGQCGQVGTFSRNLIDGCLSDEDERRHRCCRSEERRVGKECRL